jgi:hypothetical protein
MKEGEASSSDGALGKGVPALLVATFSRRRITDDVELMNQNSKQIEKINYRNQ